MDNQKVGTGWDIAGILTMGLVLVIIGTVIGFSIGLWQGSNTDVSSIDPRDEFYRGAYMACSTFTSEVFSAPEDDAEAYCAELIPKFAEAGWYESPSRGYVAPD